MLINTTREHLELSPSGFLEQNKMALNSYLCVAYVISILYIGETFPAKFGAQSRSYQRQSYEAPRPQLFLPFYHKYYFKLPNFVSEPSYKIASNFDFTKCVFRTNLKTAHDLMAPFSDPMSSRIDHYVYHKLHETPVGHKLPKSKEPRKAEVSYTFEHHFNKAKKLVNFETSVLAEHIVLCNVTKFCMLNTTQLCLRNGTVLCVARFDNVVGCEHSDLCVRTNLATPCVGKKPCVNNATDDVIPCFFNASVHGTLSTKSFKVYNAIQNVTIITVANNVAERNRETSLEEIVQKRGVVEKYCVTLVAQPILTEQKLSYSKFLMFLQKHPNVILATNVRCVLYMKSLLDMLYS